jgi:hypothetical protein
MALDGGVDPERDADHEREQCGHDDELEGGGEALGDEVEHLALVAVGDAEIALDRAPDEAGELGDGRLVAAETLRSAYALRLRR